MKKTYIPPLVRIVVLSQRDIICTSPTPDPQPNEFLLHQETTIEIW